MSKDEVMPNGRNSMGGRKPAMSAMNSAGVSGSPVAGAPDAVKQGKSYTEPGPSMDGGMMPKIPAKFGTHVGATVHMPGDGLPTRRTIKTDAK